LVRFSGAQKRLHGYAPRSVERTAPRPPQCDDVAVAAENATHVTRQRPHVRTFAAAGLEHARRSVDHLDEHQTVDEDRAWIEHDGLAAARQIIGAFTGDLDRRISRRHLHALPVKLWAPGFDVATLGALVARVCARTFGVVGIGFATPADGEAISLFA